MTVDIIYEDGKPIGWSMQGENEEEIGKLCDIRNLQFFGFEETAIKYDGRTGGDKHNPGTLSWKQRKFTSDYKSSLEADKLFHS